MSTYTVRPAYAMGLQIPDSWVVMKDGSSFATVGAQVDAQFLANLLNSVTREQVHAARMGLYQEAAE